MSPEMTKLFRLYEDCVFCLEHALEKKGASDFYINRLQVKLNTAKLALIRAIEKMEKDTK